MHAYRVVTRASERASKEAGFHRFEWDLRHPGPWRADSTGAGGGGPIVAPGSYTARLTVDGTEQLAAFEVRLDPRVAAEGITDADVQEQVQLALQVRDALSEARMTVERLEAAREDAAGDPAAELERIREALVTGEVRYSRPMLVDQISYLYGNIRRGDGAPSRDAYQRFQTLSERLRALVAEMERLLAAVTQE